MCDVLTWDILCTCWSSRTCACRIVSECHIQWQGFWYWMYLLELKWKTCSCRIVSDDIHNVMTSDMVVPAGSYKRNYWIMQDFSRMSDPMSWHPVHRTFSMNVWCFVIAQLMAIYVWLKIWFAGAFNHWLQPDLLIFQGDLNSCYKKIWLENRFRVFKMSKPSWKLL